MGVPLCAAREPAIAVIKMVAINNRKLAPCLARSTREHVWLHPLKSVFPIGLTFLPLRETTLAGRVMSQSCKRDVNSPGKPLLQRFHNSVTTLEDKLDSVVQKEKLDLCRYSSVSLVGWERVYEPGCEVSGSQRRE